MTTPTPAPPAAVELVWETPEDRVAILSVGEVTVTLTADELAETDVSNDEWIKWAQPVWWDIHETNTLNVRVARDDADERHICPLQLDFIERCVRLWSNPGETVLTPFAGIGSEVYTAVKLGRRGIGCELKPSYWRTAVMNLRQLEAEMTAPGLFDDHEWDAS